MVTRAPKLAPAPATAPAVPAAPAAPAAEAAPAAGEPAAPPSGRRRRANLERIVRAAAEVVFEVGIDGLSVKRVADLADYTPGALYRYFPSKDALLAAVTERVLADLADGYVAIARAAGKKPLAALLAMADRYRAFARDEPHAFTLVTAMAGDPRVHLGDEESAARILAAVLRVLAPVRAALDGAAALGQLAPGDASERALVLFAGLQGALVLRKHERRARGLIDAERLASATLRGLLTGWGASARALARAEKARG